MDACRSVRAAGCLLVAVAGLPVLATLLGGDPGLLATIAASLLGASFVGYLARDPRTSVAYYLLALLALAMGILLPPGAESLILALAASYAASILAVLATGRVSPGLASMALGLPAAYNLAGPGWASLYSVLVVASAGLVAYETRGRGHSMMLLAVAPLAAIVDPLIAMAASATSLMIAFAASGLIEAAGCPFTTDSGMTFIGVLLSIIAALLGLVSGFQENDPAFILWIMGFIFLEAGVLVPVGSFYNQPSSGAGDGSP